MSVRFMFVPSGGEVARNRIAGRRGGETPVSGPEQGGGAEATPAELVFVD
ncbi:hypothetical protein [Streptosporangium longisporum]